MAIVAGVDFGTLSVRVSIVDSEKGVIGSAVAEYPLHRKREDPDFATQSHDDHMRGLADASRKAVKAAGISGDQVSAIALDTTGSSVIPVGEGMVPLDDYYLWCDHRAKNEAAEITDWAHREKLPAIDWCGGVYSAEWGFAKLLHWLRHNPDKREKFASAFEHCDMVSATLCGITDPRRVKRSICAAGHKWLWHADYGGLPPEDFLVKVDPLLKGSPSQARRRIRDVGQDRGDPVAGLGGEARLEGGHSHSGRRLRRPLGRDRRGSEGGRCGQRRRHVHLHHRLCPAGAADPRLLRRRQRQRPPAIHRHRSRPLRRRRRLQRDRRTRPINVAELSKGLEGYRAGQTGLLRFPWDNGDRTVLVNANVGGIAIGWNLTHTAQDELFAAIEGTAFHTRVILDRMNEYGALTERVINGGGVPQNNPVLNQVYANVLDRPVLVPSSPVTGIGSAIFAFLAAGAFRTIEEAQAKICPKHAVFTPQPEARKPYDELYGLFRRIYFDFGKPAEGTVFSDVLPTLIRVARG